MVIYMGYNSQMNRKFALNEKPLDDNEEPFKYYGRVETNSSLIYYSHSDNNCFMYPLTEHTLEEIKLNSLPSINYQIKKALNKGILNFTITIDSLGNHCYGVNAFKYGLNLKSSDIDIKKVSGDIFDDMILERTNDTSIWGIIEIKDNKIEELI